VGQLFVGLSRVIDTRRVKQLGGGAATKGPLAEVAALFATSADFATGMPLDTTFRITGAALWLAAALKLPDSSRKDLYYLCLVRLMGCTVDSSRFAAAMGDELETSRRLAAADMRSPAQMLPILVGLRSSESLLRRARGLVTAVAFGAGMRSHIEGHCEVSQLLTDGLGLGPRVRTALDYTYERWDGRGAPEGVKGQQIPEITRVMQGGCQAALQNIAGGPQRVRDQARAMSKRGLDPQVAELLAGRTEEVLEAASAAASWDAVIALEPGVHRYRSPSQLEQAMAALAHFADLKASCLAGHSTGVAALAEAAGRQAGLDPGTSSELRLAALAHDLGRVGVSSLIWDRPGPLRESDWGEVRLHAYHTERLLGRVPALAEVAATAGLHHERMDGSGYHRSVRGSSLPVQARILAAADTYHALLEARPHRAARPGDEAARVLAAEATAGRLDRQAVECVLEAAGQRARSPRTRLPAGLSERELEVLRLIAAGSTMKQAAVQLHVSFKTIDAHVQHIYDKTGCSTRAGAAVFAMQHGLLEPELAPARD
jgi:HD-GYP domain-containing protein (c-di-GMP phosphodiesterase class II)